VNRSNLIQLLEQYHPTYQQEIESKDQILTFIKQHPNCFERSLEIGHITASAWLLSNDESQALLLHHAKLDKWFQLGGHCDGNPDVLAVAIQETQEESGINNIVAVDTQIFDIDIHLIPDNKREKAHFHYDIRFLLKVVGDEDVVQNRESKELRWIDKKQDGLPTNEPSVIRMFDKWLARK